MGLTTFFAIFIPWCLLFFLTLGLTVAVEPDIKHKIRNWIKVFILLPFIWILGIYRGIRY